MMLHYETTENFVAALREVLREVELISTSGKDCGNKKIARTVCGRVCDTGQFFVQLVSQQNLPSITQCLNYRWQELNSLY